MIFVIPLFAKEKEVSRVECPAFSVDFETQVENP